MPPATRVLVMPEPGSALLKVQVPLSFFTSVWKFAIVCAKVAVPLPFRVNRLLPPPPLMLPVIDEPVYTLSVSSPLAKLIVPISWPWLVKLMAMVPEAPMMGPAPPLYSMTPVAPLMTVFEPADASNHIAAPPACERISPWLTIRLPLPCGLTASALPAVPFDRTLAPSSMVSVVPERNSMVLAPVP